MIKTLHKGHFWVAGESKVWIWIMIKIMNFIFKMLFITPKNAVQVQNYKIHDSSIRLQCFSRNKSCKYGVYAKIEKIQWSTLNRFRRTSSSRPSFSFSEASFAHYKTNFGDRHNKSKFCDWVTEHAYVEALCMAWQTAQWKHSRWSHFFFAFGSKQKKIWKSASK